MTHETLESYIDALNNKEMQDMIFLRPLSNTVEKAKVWDALPEGKFVNEGSYDIYFIKNIQGVYVGGVLDMGWENLHVFIKPEYRRQGHLTQALREWILPYLFSDGREYQRISYQDEAAKRHALKFGFTEFEDGKGIITKDKIQEIANMQGQNIPIAETTYKEMKRKILHAAGLLKMVRDQLEMAYNETGQFNDVIEYVRNLRDEVDDIYSGCYTDE